ncbi:MAG TPA: hypothetical protein VFS12_17895, partial [Terriglobia bacterium]|nr:hypothetical protein [Terriglobia bacterium]
QPMGSSLTHGPMMAVLEAFHKMHHRAHQTGTGFTSPAGLAPTYLPERLPVRSLIASLLPPLPLDLVLVQRETPVG